jgi:hypothetical protein
MRPHARTHRARSCGSARRMRQIFDLVDFCTGFLPRLVEGLFLCFFRKAKTFGLHSTGVMSVPFRPRNGHTSGWALGACTEPLGLTRHLWEEVGVCYLLRWLGDVGKEGVWGDLCNIYAYTLLSVLNDELNSTQSTMRTARHG